MANETDVNTVRESLNAIWTNPPNRNDRFGNSLKSLSIRGIRGLELNIDFQWPVVAIGGINGCGKTTILQICSAAYTKQGTSKHHYTLGRWIGPALESESPPVATPADVRYSFWDSSPSLTVAYQEARTRWGYPRRGNPERHVEFVGITKFAPRIERLDRTHQNRARLSILNTAQLNERRVESVSRILGSSYSAAALHTVSAPNVQWEDEIPELVRGEYRYTEGHMGAGEQKTIRLVQFLEDIPDRSLVLLEEPELTLHPDAQFGLAWFLMALAKRKGHQIIIATHSPHVFEALPSEARVLLVRDGVGVTVLHSVTHLHAARELSASFKSNRDLIFVEDEVALRFLTELFRSLTSGLLKSATIIALGSAADVQRMVARLRMQKVRAVGVRDADQGESSENGLFSLPGNVSPEELLLDDANLRRAEQLLAGVCGAEQRARVQGQGYRGSEAAKKVFSGLCTELESSPSLVADRLTLAWLSETTNREASRELVADIQAACELSGTRSGNESP